MSQLRLLLGGLVLGACGETVRSSDPALRVGDASTPEPGGDAAADPRGSFTGGENGSLAVRISASRTAVCPGGCVTLTASVAGGQAPYEYVWSHGLGAKAGPVTACPVADTTYGLTVRDTPPSREFAREAEEAQARVSVAVTTDCADSGVRADEAGAPASDRDAGPSGAGGSSANAADAGGEDGAPAARRDGAVPPPRGLELECQATATVDASAGVRATEGLLNPFDMASPLAVDPAGNFILSVGFQGVFDLGSELRDDRGGNIALLVAKYDPGCRLLWSRSYSGLLSWVGGASAAASGSDTVLAGIFAGVVDLGGGLLVSGSLVGAVLAKLDASGNTRWSRAFVSTSGTEFFDVAVDPGTGDIVATGLTSGDVSFGGATLSTAGARLPFVVRFTANGDHVWSRIAPSTADVARVRVLGNGDLVLANGNNGELELHRLDPTGAELWAAQYAAPEQRFIGPPFGLAVGPADSIGTGAFLGRPESGIVLSSTVPDGSSHRDITLLRDDPDPYRGALAVTSSGLLVEASDRSNETDRDVSDYYFGREASLSLYSSGGRMMATTRYDTEMPDAPLGLAVDRDDHPILAVMTDGSWQLTMDLTLLRYAPPGL